VPGRQVAPWQQPPSQERASHWHWPPTHVCPAAHAGPCPQPQVPCAQLSAPPGQGVQPTPDQPHIVADGVSHTAPLQHPLGQLVPSQVQVPLTQCWPLSHAGPAPQRQALPTQWSVDSVVQEAHTWPALPQWRSLEV